MPRAVSSDVSRRRRDRLAELIDALGAARGAKVTQREFAASIHREQGTVAAILGGHRSLGGDVMMAIVQAYRLPGDYFDNPLKPDPRPYARAIVGDVSVASLPGTRNAPTAAANNQVFAPPPPPPPPPRMDPEPEPVATVRRLPVRNDRHDANLDAVMEAFEPDRAVSMTLEALARKGVRQDEDGWTRLLIGAQSAHEHGALVDWYDRTLASFTTLLEVMREPSHARVEAREVSPAMPVAPAGAPVKAVEDARTRKSSRASHG